MKGVRSGSCDGSGTMSVCAITSRHNHCVCGLPCNRRRTLCNLCREEGLVRVRNLHTFAALRVPWDGKTYFSRRRRRLTSRNPDSYQMLAWAIGGLSYASNRRP